MTQLNFTLDQADVSISVFERQRSAQTRPPFRQLWPSLRHVWPLIRGVNHLK